MSGQASVLHQIAESCRAGAMARKALLPERELLERCAQARRPHRFLGAFAGVGTHVIAEVKFASPSQGAIARGSEGAAVEVAGSYLANGARAISVLTEETRFGGSPAYLRAIRRAFPEALLLLKDFVVDEYQLLEARVNGADAALLIVALLGRDGTRLMLERCRELGLTALVEVHDEEELQVAGELGAELIGVNNRDLRTLRISLETSFRLARRAASGATLLSESGISEPSQIRELQKAGYSGFLIGTSLMRGGEPGRALGELLAGASRAAEEEKP